MSTPPPIPLQRRSGATLYVVYVSALAICLLGNLAIRAGTRGGWLPAWGRLPLAATTAAPLVIAMFWFWRLLRRDLDEMLQRVVLEGLSFALIVYVPLAAIFVNLRTAGAWVPRLDPPDILLTPAILVALGVGLALRRYR